MEKQNFTSFSMRITVWAENAALYEKMKKKEKKAEMQFNVDMSLFWPPQLHEIRLWDDDQDT